MEKSMSKKSLALATMVVGIVLGFSSLAMA